MYHAFPHTVNIHQLKNPMLHEDFDSQEYTMPSQSVRQNCNLVFLGKRNFIEDKNGSRPLDRRTGKVTINSAFAQCSAHKETQSNRPH